MLSILCPLCQQPLVLENKSWRCENNHCFDQAKEGYVNLLPVQNKKSREPGDATSMVIGRRDFLAAHHYQPLQEKLTQIIVSLSPQTLLDIGCGEGYYTAAIAQQCLTDDSATLIGIDISKAAIRLAAKKQKSDIEKHPRITYLVATAVNLPVSDNSLDIVTSFFSPLPKAEMLRALSNEGRLIFATPNSNHLLSLRGQLFDQVTPHHPDKFLTDLAPEFELLETHEVNIALSLNQQDIINLLEMTPYGWRAKPEKKQALENLSALNTEAQFVIYVMKKSEQ